MGKQINVRELLNALKNIADHAKLVSVAYGGEGGQDYVAIFPQSAYYVGWSSGNNAELGVSFVGKGLPTLVSEVIQAYWRADSMLEQTVSERYVETHVANLVRKSLQGEAKLDTAAVKQIFSDLRTLPVLEWTVFRTLHGASMSAGEPVVLGPFTIYHWTEHAGLILDRHFRQAEWRTKLHDSGMEGLVVAVRTKACDGQRARELADPRFGQFESFVRYMRGDLHGSSDIGIFDYDQASRTNYVATTLEHYGEHMGTGSQGARRDVDISNPHYLDSSLGNKQLWSLLGKLYSDGVEDGDTIAGRIVSAVMWLGKGVRDRDLGRRLVQFLFALEAPFTSGDKAVSIVDRLADYTAFTIEKDLEGRDRTARKVKELYGKRSGLAHGRSEDVNWDDMASAFNLVRRAIIALLTDQDLANLALMKNLDDRIRRLRYS